LRLWEIAARAHCNVGLREAALPSLARYTRYTITDPAALRRTLAAVRRDGYAISDRQIEVVSLSVAAPVRAANGDVVAAVSIVIPARTQPQRFVPAVLTTARGISRAIAIGAAAVEIRRRRKAFRPACGPQP